ncbi:MAG TPA: nucleotidyltransferase domain-containing protein [Alphaproteobacteria bacterium]|nr:nucleotidyltransferase domain-containing protein [Alphaproteobacteria bacterium]
MAKVKSSSDKISKILEKVSSQIKPDMSAVSDADFVVEKINSILKKKKIDAECVKGGSIAKGTFLKDDYDIDLFVRFNRSYEDKEISNILEPVIAEICKSMKTKLERIHGSRDYYQFTIQKAGKNKTDLKELSFEIIPVILIHASNHYDANNSTDLSPEHVNWVLKHTKKNPELTSDIRLAKQFCKANKVYGAESYINGFSGHIIDILVIHFGSFINLIKKFSEFELDKIKDKPIIIDTEKHLTSPLKELNPSKITSLIVVDPIQPYRNSAAAVSLETLKKFIEVCKLFLKNPGEKFFEIKKYDIHQEMKDSLKQASKKSRMTDKKIIKLILEITTVDGSKDVVGTKALKAYESMLENLKANDFIVLGSGWNFDFEKKLAQVFLLIDSNITKHYIQRGPPVSSSADYKRFVDKHTSLKHKILKKGNAVSAIVPRKFTDPVELIKEISKKDPVVSKIKNIKIVRA